MTQPSSEPLDYTRLAAARLRAAEAQPFLAMALYALTPVADASRPTFAVDERWRLYVNPQKLREWSIAQLAGVLLHEVGHVLRDHAGRARTIGVSDERSRHLWNVAADAEINDDLIAARIKLPPKPVTPRRLRMPRYKVAEFYFASLAQAPAAPGPLPDCDCGSGCHGHGDTGDSPLLPPGLSGAEALLLRRRVAEEITRIAAQRAGAMTAGWQRWAEAVMRPQMDWRKLLTAKVRSSTAAVSGAADYSYARPSRRRVPRVVLPAMRRPVPRVALIVDTSGSVTDDLLAMAWTEVHGCLQSLGIRRDLLTVYAADVAAYLLTGPPRRQVNLMGGGGTDMAAAITTVLATRPAPDLVVVITDGLTPWPPAPPRRDVIVALLPATAVRPAPPSWAHVVEISADHPAAAAPTGRDPTGGGLS